MIEKINKNLNRVVSTLKLLISHYEKKATPRKQLKEIRWSLSCALECVEKQIPKKPDFEGDGYADGDLVYDYAKCPICGHDFEYGINDWGCDYCSDCGQKLDWSNEDM